MRFFGFEIQRASDKEEKERVSFAQPAFDDGAVNVTAAGGAQASYIDLEGTVRTEADLVRKYRQMLLQPEIEKAVNEIVNEAIVQQENQDTIELLLEDVKIGDNIKKKIVEEWDLILRLLDFDKNAYDIFRRWLVDGRSYYHVIIDPEKPQDGIKELRYVDPRNIRKMRESVKLTDPVTRVTVTKIVREYYLFAEKGLGNQASNGMAPSSNQGVMGVKIATGSIIHTTSGVMDTNNSLVLSYMHNAIKPLNQLRALEDATLIYHLSRAPERRIFSIDVGNMPKMKAEQHVRDMMTRHKNKISYNAATGETSDDRKFMHMLEDYWFPKREGRGTEVDILSGGAQLPDLLQSVEYFQDRLYRSLQVPLTRLKPDAVYNLGRATEITRDEVNFSKFIDRLRGKFVEFLTDALYKQLVLKKIVVPADWDADIKFQLKYKFARDNYFTELKDLEIMNDRLIRMRDADDFAGKYYSHEWIRRNILRQTDADIKEQDKQIEGELSDPRFAPPEPEPEPGADPNALPPEGPPQ